MITYLEVYPLLVAACPTYERSAHAARADERNGEFLRVGHLVAHVLELIEDDMTEELISLSGVIDWVLAEGDGEARSLITIGVLADLTEGARSPRIARDPSDFVSWLGPRASQHPSVQELL